MTRWNDYAIDIIANSGGKAAGIKEYLKINNISQEETTETLIANIQSSRNLVCVWLKYKCIN